VLGHRGASVSRQVAAFLRGKQTDQRLLMHDRGYEYLIDDRPIDQFTAQTTVATVVDQAEQPVARLDHSGIERASPPPRSYTNQYTLSCTDWNP